jgi:hypothetical protein
VRTGLRIAENDIQQLASEAGVSTEELYDKMMDAKLDFNREQDKRWSYEFFGEDEAWYDETMKKVKEIKDALPNDMNPIEATIKQYGWISKNGKKQLSMPLMWSDTYPEYAHAVAVEYILTKPDSYHRMMNWN